MTPRIAIPVPTSIDLSFNQRCGLTYAAAVARSGGEPVTIDLSASTSQITALAASCDGVLLPGSPADVDPALYGSDRDPACGRPDPLRAEVDYFLLDHAARHAKPVLAICYGVQSLNVWSGGSLIQDLAPLPVNHSAGDSVAIAHTALITSGSILASLLTSDEAPESSGFLRLPVNTNHHQAIAIPGAGLRVTARCPDDGVIEAIELDTVMFHVEHNAPTQFLLGVQWHPERSYDISAASRALFQRLVSEAMLSAEARIAAERQSTEIPAR